jgi:hypothetical protein
VIILIIYYFSISTIESECHPPITDTCFLPIYNEINCLICAFTNSNNLTPLFLLKGLVIPATTLSSRKLFILEEPKLNFLTIGKTRKKVSKLPLVIISYVRLPP